MTARFLCALIDLPQVIAGAALTVYAIWFADVRQHGVGALVSHSAEVVAISFLTHACAAALWLLWRHRRAERRLLGRTWMASTSALVALFVVISHFRYAGAG
ncbi:MAG: hypothetical protein KA795_01685 [Burkholderiaceae bacterium]|nr:hypothetical protein [Burkholderiaceae bacterium]